MFIRKMSTQYRCNQIFLLFNRCTSSFIAFIFTIIRNKFSKSDESCAYGNLSIKVIPFSLNKLKFAYAMRIILLENIFWRLSAKNFKMCGLNASSNIDKYHSFVIRPSHKPVSPKPANSIHPHDIMWCNSCNTIELIKLIPHPKN